MTDKTMDREEIEDYICDELYQDSRDLLNDISFRRRYSDQCIILIRMDGAIIYAKDEKIFNLTKGANKKNSKGSINSREVDLPNSECEELR